jgi:hypothetical protein
MSSSSVVVALPAILFGGLLAIASAQARPGGTDIKAVLDEVRKNYQNLAAYQFARVLLVQAARNVGALETIAELTLASATEGAKRLSDEPFPPMNSDRFRLATRTRQGELLQVWRILPLLRRPVRPTARRSGSVSRKGRRCGSPTIKDGSGLDASRYLRRTA